MNTRQEVIYQVNQTEILHIQPRQMKPTLTRQIHHNQKSDFS